MDGIPTGTEEKISLKSYTKITRLGQYLGLRIRKGGVAKIVIERTLKRITITVHTARPGVVIGKGGSEVDKIKEEIKKITKKDVQINIFEIKRPELDATLVSESVGIAN